MIENEEYKLDDGNRLKKEKEKGRLKMKQTRLMMKIGQKEKEDENKKFEDDYGRVERERLKYMKVDGTERKKIKK